MATGKRFEVQIKEGGKWKRHPDQYKDLTEIQANATMAAIRTVVDGSTELRVHPRDE